MNPDAERIAAQLEHLKLWRSQGVAGEIGDYHTTSNISTIIVLIRTYACQKKKNRYFKLRIKTGLFSNFDVFATQD